MTREQFTFMVMLNTGLAGADTWTVVILWLFTVGISVTIS